MNDEVSRPMTPLLPPGVELGEFKPHAWYSEPLDTLYIHLKDVSYTTRRVGDGMISLHIDNSDPEGERVVGVEIACFSQFIRHL